MLIITLHMDVLSHRIILMFIVRDMLLKAHRGRENFLQSPLINNITEIWILCYHNCLRNASFLASLNTGDLATTWANSLEICEREKLVTKSFVSPLQVGGERRLQALSFSVFTYIAAFFIKLTLMSKLCKVQATAKKNRIVTHHKQTKK